MKREVSVFFSVRSLLLELCQGKPRSGKTRYKWAGATAPKSVMTRSRRRSQQRLYHTQKYNEGCGRKNGRRRHNFVVLTKILFILVLFDSSRRDLSNYIKFVIKWGGG